MPGLVSWTVRFVGVQQQLVGADQGAGLGELLRVGQLAVAPGPPPEPADRGDGHVEGAPGPLVKLLRPREDVEQVGTDRERGDRRPCRERRDSSLSG